MLADVLGDWFAQDDFRGCAFINAVAETGAGDEPQQLQQALVHKRGLEAYIAELAGRLALQAPDQVAQEAMLCVEGMIVRAQMRRDPHIVAAGRRLLQRIEQDAAPAAAAKPVKTVKPAKKAKLGKSPKRPARPD